MEPLLTISADLNSIIQTIIFGLTLATTIVGSLFLFNTLKAQRLSNDLSNEKFLLDIRPFFESSEYIKESTTNVLSFIQFNVVANKNIARNLKIVKDFDFPHQSYFVREMEVVPIGRKIEILQGPFYNSDFSQEIKFSLYFTDDIGTKYVQVVHGTLTDLVIDPPKKIFLFAVFAIVGVVTNNPDCLFAAGIHIAMPVCSTR